MHGLRRHEEGQTLVLAALFGLILALCVLGTVNLGRAVYDKMAVQTACDNGAYSQAAVEARVINFTAYTNRAMVVHYASILAMSAYLTWMHYTWALVKGLLKIAGFIPGIGAIFTAISNVINAIVTILDGAVAALTPLTAAANVILYGLQEGAWWSVYFGRLSKLPPEAHSGDSTAAEYTALWPNIVPAANMAVFAQSRGHLTVPQSTLEAASIFLNAKSDVVQSARMHMVEVANSARTPWVAYGDNYDRGSFSPIARHSNLPIPVCNVNIGSIARTELGSWAPQGRGRASKALGQVFSGDLFQANYRCFGKSGTVSIFGATSLDDFFVSGSLKFLGVRNSPGSGVVGLILRVILSPLNFLQGYANSNAKIKPAQLDYRAFWISPYVYFAPQGTGKPHGGLRSPGSLGNFAQPDVILGVAREGRDFNRAQGTKYFGGKRSVSSGAGTGTVDFDYENADWPRVPGLPGVLQLRKGFNALCAAQVYYHRPGEWREMPNFFNPLWGARLMPVAESNALNSVPGSAAVVAALKPFLLH
jgi:hypothetical protein